MKIPRLAFLGAAALFCAYGAHAQSLGVQLHWSASASSTSAAPGTATVYRAPATANGASCGAFASISSAAPAAGPYTDATVTDGAWYCYRVTATVPGYAVESTPSNTITIQVALSTGPAAPGGLSATVVSLTSAPAAAAVVKNLRPSAPKIQ